MDNLWTMERCADFIGVSYDHFRRKLKQMPQQFPPPLDIGGRPRWHPDDWARWADGLRKS